MRNLQITVIALFLVVAIAFSVFFCFDRLTVDHAVRTGKINILENTCAL